MQTSGANEASCILATTQRLVLGAVAARAEVTAVTFNSALEFCKRQLGVIKANIVCRKLLLLVCCCYNCCCCRCCFRKMRLLLATSAYCCCPAYCNKAATTFTTTERYYNKNSSNNNFVAIVFIFITIRLLFVVIAFVAMFLCTYVYACLYMLLPLLLLLRLFYLLLLLALCEYLFKEAVNLFDLIAELLARIFDQSKFFRQSEEEKTSYKKQ